MVPGLPCLSSLTHLRHLSHSKFIKFVYVFKFINTASVLQCFGLPWRCTLHLLCRCGCLARSPQPLQGQRSHAPAGLTVITSFNFGWQDAKMWEQGPWQLEESNVNCDRFFWNRLLFRVFLKPQRMQPIYISRCLCMQQCTWLALRPGLLSS